MAKQNLSVEEILAACRAQDGEGATTSSTSTPAEEATAAPPDVDQTGAASDSETAAPAKPASRSMSVEEMLAMARSEKSGGDATKASPKAAPESASSSATKPASRNMSVEEMLAAARGEKSAPKSKTKSPAAKPAAKASPKPASAKSDKMTGPRDTSSILAAARADAKRGPISKSEAASQGKPTKPKLQVPPKPEKPKYAKAAPTASAKDEDRRGFMSVLFGSFLALGFTCLSAVSALWGLGLARYLFPNILTEPPSQFKVGFPSDFPAEAVATKFKAQYGVWVVNTEYDGQQMITALKPVCTHLGCTPNWLEGEQKFKCPCHGSGFYIDGINFEGPAPRPLERYAVHVADDGQLEVDKGRTFQQELGQWNDPTSFVPV